MTTPRDLISQALRASGIVGIGQTPRSDDVTDAFFALQALAGQWARKRWLNPHLADVVVPLTGAAPYTIGLGGAINTARPDRIEAAFVRMRPSATYPTDWPVRVIDNREDWNRVRSKYARGVPAALFYDSAYPLGQVWVWPNTQPGQTTYELHLSVKGGVAAFASLDADTGLPPEYDAALLYNLIVRLRLAYELPPNPAVVTLARDALNVLRMANTQVPVLQMPAGLPGTRGGPGDHWLGIGMGGDPGFNTATGFRIGISSLDGTDIILPG